MKVGHLLLLGSSTNVRIEAESDELDGLGVATDDVIIDCVAKFAADLFCCDRIETKLAVGGRRGGNKEVDDEDDEEDVIANDEGEGVTK
jgi:hypothetical protein